MRSPLRSSLHWPAFVAAAILLAGSTAAQSQTAPAKPTNPAAASAAAKPAADAGSAAAPRQLAIANKVWTGDFDQMLERRVIRVFAPYSRSLYFSDKGRERGLAAELIRDFERYLNVKYAKQLGKRPLTVYIGPATRDKLLPDVAGGLADIAIGNLTVTDARLKLVDFVALDEGRRTISEVVVTGPNTPRSPRSTILPARRFTCARRRATTRALSSSTRASRRTANPR